MAKIIIIFGSTSGNTEIVCRKAETLLKEKGHSLTVQRAELSQPEDIKGSDLCILAASTYGHGIIQDHMIPFIKAFKKHDWSGQKFAVIGLGDCKYDNHYNIESAFIISDAIKESKGEIIHDHLGINKNPVWQLDKVESWVDSLDQTITSQ